ncbi:MAG: SDR family oxidoreductase [Candidatus Omnitrophica bacterium]|nr:SDR family oxidoreductase [Candidatus Omnitrophota bacterium]
MTNFFDLTGKTIFITGATGFFGKYISEAMLEAGGNVILLGRSKKVTAFVGQCNEKYGSGRATGFLQDMYDLEGLEKLLQTIAQDFDIDAIINNAYDLGKKTGFNSKESWFENLDHQTWKNAFESGIYWSVLTIKIIGETFKKKKAGSIINISSMYATVSPDPGLYEGTDFMNPATYGVNKSGILAFTRYIASFWGKYNIRCNAVVPGAFPNLETETENSVSDDNDFFIERLKEKTVLKRVGHPKDLVGTFIFLVSDASSYMTGQSIVIDGGWTIK